MAVVRDRRRVVGRADEVEALQAAEGVSRGSSVLPWMVVHRSLCTSQSMILYQHRGRRFAFRVFIQDPYDVAARLMSSGCICALLLCYDRVDCTCTRTKLVTRICTVGIFMVPVRVDGSHTIPACDVHLCSGKGCLHGTSRSLRCLFSIQSMCIIVYHRWLNLGDPPSFLREVGRNQ